MSYRKILFLWLPLAATWLMMAVEGPFLAAVIARLADPEYNLAAYGVAFSFAFIVEAPIIMILSASTALVRDRDSFLRLRRFTFVLNGLLTAVMLAVIFTPLFEIAAYDWIRLPEPVARLAHRAMVLFLPWPGAIGYRRFYQGLFIRYDMARRVTYGTLIRLIAMASTAIVLARFFPVEGALVGAASLSAGVSAEAVASRLMVRGIVKRLLETRTSETGERPLTYAQITSFYVPLGLTSLISLAAQPMITFFLGRSRFALESLVVHPVVNSLGFVFGSLGLSYQEVGIALLGERGEYFPRLRAFATWLAALTACGLGLIAFTPLNRVWFHTVSGLSLDLTRFARLPARILTLMPAFTALLAFQRAVLVNGRRTRPITWTALVEVSGIFAVLFVGIRVLDMVGAAAAATAVVAGRAGGNLFLLPWSLKVRRDAVGPQGPPTSATGPSQPVHPDA